MVAAAVAATELWRSHGRLHHGLVLDNIFYLKIIFLKINCEKHPRQIVKQINSCLTHFLDQIITNMYAQAQISASSS
jgi:hypothetical protein